MTNRRYLPTLSELIDRLSIVQLKEVFIPEHKDEYCEEISDILREYSILGTHLKSAGTKYEDVRKKIEGVELKLTSFKDQDLVEDEIKTESIP